MKLSVCQRHWSDLRLALQERGLGKYESKDGEAALDKLQKWSAGDCRLETFEPPLLSNNALVAKFVDESDPQRLLDGGCPLCVVDGYKLARNWINGVADSMLELAKAVGHRPGG